MKFLGRQKELIKLREFQAKRSASLIVMRGRRRIGKSRLLEEFGKDFSQAYYFSGLPPEEKTTTRHQLEEFSRQMAPDFRIFLCNKMIEVRIYGVFEGVGHHI